MEKESKKAGSPKRIKKARQVTEEEAQQFATNEGLIFLGETSCMDGVNNCN